jgi:hypothetical protein
MLPGGIFYLLLLSIILGRRFALEEDCGGGPVLRAGVALVHVFAVLVYAIPGLALLFLCAWYAGLIGAAGALAGAAVSADLWRRSYRGRPWSSPKRKALVGASKGLFWGYAVQLLAATVLLIAGTGATTPAHFVPGVGLWSILEPQVVNAYEGLKEEALKKLKEAAGSHGKTGSS